MKQWIFRFAALAALSVPAAAGQASAVIGASSHRFEIAGWRVDCVTAQRLFDHCDARGPVAAAAVTLAATRDGVKLEVSGCGLRPRPPMEEIFWPRDGFQIEPVLVRLIEELRLGTGACRAARLEGAERERLRDLILLLFAATN